jgi:Phage portal protein
MPVTESAREIALAFGVPPMLLAIAGDNTYANYQEANRAFWRQSVLPLAARIACAPPAAVSTISYASSRASASATSTKGRVCAGGAEQKEPRLPGAPLRSSRVLRLSRT